LANGKAQVNYLPLLVALVMIAGSAVAQTPPLTDHPPSTTATGVSTRVD